QLVRNRDDSGDRVAACPWHRLDGGCEHPVHIRPRDTNPCLADVDANAHARTKPAHAPVAPSPCATDASASPSFAASVPPPCAISSRPPPPPPSTADAPLARRPAFAPRARAASFVATITTGRSPTVAPRATTAGAEPSLSR